MMRKNYCCQLVRHPKTSKSCMDLACRGISLSGCNTLRLYLSTPKKLKTFLNKKKSPICAPTSVNESAPTNQEIATKHETSNTLNHPVLFNEEKCKEQIEKIRSELNDNNSPLVQKYGRALKKLSAELYTAKLVEVSCCSNCKACMHLWNCFKTQMITHTVLL